VDEREREELVEALVDELARRRTPDATRLLELMRIERSLSDSLAVIRREIDLIVRSVRPLPEDS
jgi:hypothetical protein